MKNQIVLLRSGNIILQVLGQFRTKELARWFIEDNYPEFHKDICQWSRFESPEFITIEQPPSGIKLKHQTAVIDWCDLKAK